MIEYIDGEPVFKKAVKLAKTTICPCGFPTVNTLVQPGYTYTVLPHVVASFDYKCGGCKRLTKVCGVFVEGNAHSGFLPADIFWLPDLTWPNDLIQKYREDFLREKGFPII